MKTTLLFALLTLGTSAFAMDGNTLLDTCSVVDKTELTSADLISVAACNNYIAGVLDALVIMQSAHPKEIKSSVCAPDDSGINTVQGARIVVKYLRDNPDKLHWTASVLVINAIHVAFPCR